MEKDANGVERAADSATALVPSTLSVHQAFVVQFRDSPGASERVWHGRVEHVASGRSAAFTTREALLDFLASAAHGS